MLLVEEVVVCGGEGLFDERPFIRGEIRPQVPAAVVALTERDPAPLRRGSRGRRVVGAGGVVGAGAGGVGGERVAGERPGELTHRAQAGQGGGGTLEAGRDVSCDDRDLIEGELPGPERLHRRGQLPGPAGNPQEPAGLTG